MEGKTTFIIVWCRGNGKNSTAVTDENIMKCTQASAVSTPELPPDPRRMPPGEETRRKGKGVRRPLVMRSEDPQADQFPVEITSSWAPTPALPQVHGADIRR